MSISNHEKNYTPSWWSKRYGHDEILLQHSKLSTEVTTDARGNLNCELDIPYGSTDRTKYDVYGTNLPKDAPVFVFIHGGYWQEGGKELAAYAAPVFVAKGIKVITVGYDLCPDVRIGDIVSQIKTVIEQILKSASTNGNRVVWVAGHSAGAHLAASLLYDKLWLDKMTEYGYLKLLKGVVLLSGIYSLKPLLGTTINNNLQLTKDEIEAYSFNAMDTKNYKPTEGLKVIVTCGECDSEVFINETQECAQKLIKMVDHVQYILLREDVDHFDIAERLVDTEYTLTKLLLSNILRG